MNDANHPALSLVITSYTAERLDDICELLLSVKAQTLSEMETIFVVERSDELRDRLAAFIAKNAVPNVDIVFSTEPLGLSGARNLGIDRAVADIIAFVDDDVLLYEDWAEQMVRAFDDPDVIGATGSAFPLWENDSLTWLPEQFYWLVSCTAWTGWEQRRIVRGAFGSNMAFRKEAFAAGRRFAVNAGFCGGHRDRPISEDIEFSLRLRQSTGRTIVFDPGPRVKHRVEPFRLGLRYIAQRSHHVGCTRRIIRHFYDDTFGTMDQERSVLKGIVSILARTPKELVTRPVVAWKRLWLIATVLASLTVGYLVPFPSYSHVLEEARE